MLGVSNSVSTCKDSADQVDHVGFRVEGIKGKVEILSRVVQPKFDCPVHSLDNKSKIYIIAVYVPDVNITVQQCAIPMFWPH